MPVRKRTIAIIHPGGLGDVILAIPAMVRLRNRLPDHRLLLCAGDQIAKLLLECCIVDAWISVESRNVAQLFSGANSATSRTQTWLEGCDRVIGWMQDLDKKLYETLKAIGVREVLVRSPFSAEIRATHQRDRFLEAINESPYDNDEGDVLLTVTERIRHLGRASLEAAGLSTGKPIVVVHPGSGSLHKCVAAETMASVVVAVQASVATPVVLEGPADRESVKRLLLSCVNPPQILNGLDLPAVAGVLAQAQLFVGQDSAITHMAGLMGVPTVALFGPTDPYRWAPRGDHVTVVRGAPCTCRSWGEVSQCKEKPCLKIPQDHLVAVCLAQLNDSVIPQRIHSRCLVTDHPVC